MALINYTSIINSFVSTEGAAGFMTNYIYYSVLVVYTDGTKEIVEGKKAQIAPLLVYLRTPVDELQDIKKYITSLPDDISNIKNKIDDNVNYVLDTICPIPDVRGMKEEEAIKQIEEYGLVPNISQSDIVSKNQGTVGFLQRNRFNFKHVDIGITHSIPAVDGLTKDVAIEVLEKAGFQYNINYIPSLEQEHDIVLEYSRINGMSPVVELNVGVISKEEQKRIEEQRRKEEEQKLLEEQRKREVEQQKKEEEQRRLIELKKKTKFICTSCGATNPGWYQKCPNCGAVGHMKRNSEEEQKRFRKHNGEVEEPQKKQEEQKRLEEQRKKDEIALFAAAEKTRISKFHEIGEEVVFGKYPQEESGIKTELVWSVLNTEGNKTLLISKLALDSQKYNQECVETSWEKCSLRKWLNKDFFETAFSEDEKKAVCITKLSDEKTEDKIFLLNEAEINQYYVYKQYRPCQITPYAQEKGAYCNNIGRGWWWLRTIGKNKNNALCVETAGNIKSVDVDNSDCAVRPVMWIDTNLLSAFKET